MSGIMCLTALEAATLLYLLAFTIGDWEERMIVRVMALFACIAMGIFAPGIAALGIAMLFMLTIAATIAAEVKSQPEHDGA